jgi:hypothetical protein
MRDNVHRYGLTEEDQANLLRAIGVFVRTAIADALGPIERRLIMLESRGIQYCGAYQRSAEYKRGDVVSQSNTMWCAICDTGPGEIPGVSHYWQLCDKSERERQQRRATQGGARSSSTIERRTNNT